MSVYCQTNMLCTTYFPLTVFDSFASWMINLSSWVLFRWVAGMEAASMMMSKVPISARLWTMKVFMAVRKLWRVVSRFSGLLECAAPNIASFLLGWQHLTLQTSEEEPHQIRMVPIWWIITCSIRCRTLFIKSELQFISKVLKSIQGLTFWWKVYHFKQQDLKCFDWLYLVWHHSITLPVTEELQSKQDNPRSTISNWVFPRYF